MSCLCFTQVTQGKRGEEHQLKLLTLKTDLNLLLQGLEKRYSFVAFVETGSSTSTFNIHKIMHSLLIFSCLMDLWLHFFFCAVIN